MHFVDKARERSSRAGLLGWEWFRNEEGGYENS